MNDFLKCHLLMCVHDHKKLFLHKNIRPVVAVCQKSVKHGSEVQHSGANEAGPAGMQEQVHKWGHFE